MPWYRIVQLSIMALGIITGAFHLNRLSKSSKWLLALLIISFFNELASWYFAQTAKTNYALSYLFIPIQYALLARAFSIDLRLLRKYINYSIYLLIALSIFLAITNWNALQEIYPSSIRTIANVFIIILSLLWFRQLLESVKNHPFTDYTMFWMSLGWLLFVIVTLVNFSAFNYLIDNARNAKLLFRNVRIYANFLLYVLFVFALNCRQRQIEYE